MGIALEQARLAGARHEVPVGAVVLGPTGKVLAEAGNDVAIENDICRHAEYLAMRAAAAAMVGAAATAAYGTRLRHCDLVVTLEPCAFCASAAVLFRVRRVIFGAYDPKGGGVEHGPRIFDAPNCLHRPEVIGGVREAECAALLKEFFFQRRPFKLPATPR